MLIPSIDCRNSLILLRFLKSPVRPLAPRQSKRYIACSDFFAKNQSLAHAAALPLPQKIPVSRSACAFKRARCRFVTFSIFCGRAFGAYLRSFLLSPVKLIAP